MKAIKATTITAVLALALALVPAAFAEEQAEMLTLPELDVIVAAEYDEAADAPELVLDPSTYADVDAAADVEVDAEADGAADGVTEELLDSPAADNSADEAEPVIAPAPVPNLGDGWYRIGMAADESIVLDVANGSSKAGTNVQVYSENAWPAQLFRFAAADEGYWRIVNAAADKPLAVADATASRATNVQIADVADSAAQLFSIIDNGDGTYTFINKATGLALDVAWGKAERGTNLQAFKSNLTLGQRFILHAVENLMPEGLMNVVPVASSRVLDVASADWRAGANVQTWAANGGFAQKWLVKAVEGEVNTYTLRVVASGKYLSAEEGSRNVTQQLLSDYAKWQPTINKGAFVLVNKATGLALDLANGRDANGTNIQTYNVHGGVAQRFGLRTTQPVPEGTYFLQAAANSEYVVEIHGNSDANGANIALFKNGTLGGQMWKFQRNADGTYTLLNARNGKALDVEDGVMANGTNVRLWPANGKPAQKWRITWDGAFHLQSALDPSFSLDIANGKSANNANVQLYSTNGASAQNFFLKATEYVPPMPPTQRYMYNLAQGMSSATNWLMLVDTNDPYVGIFYGSKGNWDMVHFWQASCGKPSTPTVKGYFTIQERGTSFGWGHGYTCWYYTQFYGDYLFHSLLYEEGSMTRELEGANTLGVNRSQGCVRVLLHQAKWIYDTIPRGTQVYIY